MLGAVASRVLYTDEVHSAVSQALQADEDGARSPMRWFIQGLLDETDDVDADALTDVVRSSSFAMQNPDWLPCLLARLPSGAQELHVRTDCLVEELKLLLGAVRFGARHPAGTEGLADCRTVLRGTSTSGPLGSAWKLRGGTNGITSAADRHLAAVRTSRIRITRITSSKGVGHGHPEAPRSESRATLRAWSSCSSTCSKPTRCRRWPRRWQAIHHGSKNGVDAVLVRAGRTMTRIRPNGRRASEERPRMSTAPRLSALRMVAEAPWNDVKRLRCRNRALTWTMAILSFADEHDRREVAESILGHAFGCAGFHEGRCANGRIDRAPRGWSVVLVSSRGLQTSASNQLGAVCLPHGDAGRPYRVRADFYRELEVRYRDSAPRTARVMRLLQRRFADQGRWADDHRRLDDRRDAQG